jgi:hypothetical protein
MAVLFDLSKPASTALKKSTSFWRFPRRHLAHAGAHHAAVDVVVGIAGLARTSSARR